MRKDVQLILVSDLHLSDKPPRARSGEPNWFSAMKRQLDELRMLFTKCECPVVIAGDIFDKPDPSPELINFAINHLPQYVYAVAGQHDLPFHSRKDISKSGYWTLKLADVIQHFGDVELYFDRHDPIATLSGFSFEDKFLPPTPNLDNRKLFQIACIHKYVWSTKQNSYPNAPANAKTAALVKECPGYDIIHSGDNHKGFITKVGETIICNCGTFYRRTTDEIDYKPFVGLVTLSNNKLQVSPYYMDISKDIILQTEKEEISDSLELEEIASFLEELQNLKDTKISLASCINDYLRRHETSTRVKNLLLTAVRKGE